MASMARADKPVVALANHNPPGLSFNMQIRKAASSKKLDDKQATS